MKKLFISIFLLILILSLSSCAEITKEEITQCQKEAKFSIWDKVWYKDWYFANHITKWKISDIDCSGWFVIYSFISLEWEKWLESWEINFIRL